MSPKFGPLSPEDRPNFGAVKLWGEIRNREVVSMSNENITVTVFVEELTSDPKGTLLEFFFGNAWRPDMPMDASKMDRERPVSVLCIKLTALWVVNANSSACWRMWVHGFFFFFLLLISVLLLSFYTFVRTSISLVVLVTLTSEKKKKLQVNNSLVPTEVTGSCSLLAKLLDELSWIIFPDQSWPFRTQFAEKRALMGVLVEHREDQLFLRLCEEFFIVAQPASHLSSKFLRKVYWARASFNRVYLIKEANHFTTSWTRRFSPPDQHFIEIIELWLIFHVQAFSPIPYVFTVQLVVIKRSAKTQSWALYKRQIHEDKKQEGADANQHSRREIAPPRRHGPSRLSRRQDGRCWRK